MKWFPEKQMWRAGTRAALTLAVAVGAFCHASAFAPASGDLAKTNPTDIRVLTWNVLDHFIGTPARDGQFKRIIEAVNPDIIAMQEVDYTMPGAGSNARLTALVKERLETYAPGYTWRVYVGEGSGNKNVIASRFPISMTRRDTEPGSDIRGVCMALVDLPNATYARDLYVMCVHFKCCDDSIDDHRRRQVHADACINWMRDARTPGGHINLPAGTPMLIVGDTNLLNRGDAAPYHASKTLIDGTIYHTATYGQSSAPEWDGTNNTDVAPYDHVTANPGTASSWDPVARIDRFIYTDSVMHHTNRFILNTESMSAAALNRAGLQSNDSRASDHLPTVADFALGADPLPPPRLLINEYSANDHLGDDRSFVEFINIGGREINLDAPADLWLKRAAELPTSPPSQSSELEGYDLNGVVPANGLFVIYDGSHESAAIKPEIEAALPRLQRQNVSSFILTNHDNSAIALVERGRRDVNVTSETLVEAYGYADATPGTTRYFRTSTGNRLTFPLGPNQWTTMNVGAVGVDSSISRNPGDTTLNSYVNWTIGSAMTPGVQNPAASYISDWTLY